MILQPFFLRIQCEERCEMRGNTAKLTYLYLKAIVDAVFDSNGDEKLVELRSSAIKAVYVQSLAYFKEGFLACIIEDLFEKKAQFINGAAAKQEIKEILKPSVPHYDYNSLIPTSIYHVDEEELLLWSLVSPCTKLMDCAVERYKELFIKILPEQAALIGIKK